VVFIATLISTLVMTSMEILFDLVVSVLVI
jgi:hypothetical protein